MLLVVDQSSVHSGRGGGDCMRVLVNGMASVGDRTGIGHYTGELVRCLREQAGPDAVDCFPPPWLAAARRMGGRLARGKPAASQPSRSPSPLSWKSRLTTACRSAFNGLL